ncbi:MAG: hypothetical protein ACLTZI_15370 [[Eubacterium] siraeum]
MRKFLNNVLMLAAAFFAGTATVSVIEYANIIADRPDNSIGGEVLIIPLMLVILYIGWILAKMYFSIIVADKIYNNAYKKAITKANQNNLRSKSSRVMSPWTVTSP